MRAAIASFGLAALCACLAATIDGPDLPVLLLGIIVLTSGVVTLFQSDSLNWSLAVIFGQGFVLVAAMTLTRPWLHQDFGRSAQVAWAAMGVCALVNLSTKRHQLLSLVGYLWLNAVLSWVAARDPWNGPMPWWGKLGAFLVNFLVGAVILSLPVTLGALRRYWSRNRRTDTSR